MSTGALFHDEMSETTGVGMSDWVISEQVLARCRRLVAFNKAMNRYSIAAPRWPLKWPAKWVHSASSFCLLSPWQPPGQYRASSQLMAESSALVMIHQAMCSVLYRQPAHRHDHKNGPQRRYIHLPLPAILIAVIIAKDHLMVH